MIRKSIEHGTKVFSEVYGFGTFMEWSECDVAIIYFKDWITPLKLKDLIEINVVDEIFDPPS